MVDRVVALTPDLWPAFEQLFGRQGACSGCWCIHWRVPRSDYVAWRGPKAKAFFKRRVMKGPPPGVLAFEGEEAVGWLQIGPRADVPQFNSQRRATAPTKRRGGPETYRPATNAGTFSARNAKMASTSRFTSARRATSPRNPNPTA